MGAEDAAETTVAAVVEAEPLSDGFLRRTGVDERLDAAVAVVVDRLAEDTVGEAGVLEPVGADERGLRVEGIKRYG